ncbi:Mu transposase C-terminal domain-containing protein [Photobacterium damselae subsp. damselae]|uniref:transposase domain-containing protein n=1 Tax=Photobacterium damselae TaxID=38293 RepID=UPI001F1F0039|nr:transposase domain-containing protein [Photobacterium damselae]UJZ95016.1 Mu transposase C-terminal domain-containing protein [Photobacterium damselae subsp. damselae]UJZ98997.1 Mu transposase C-terminal domain-containing protein [Photobacterium damselae subsp. damselae]
MNMWFTSKELAGLPLMPTTSNKVRAKLDKLISSNPERKRKRQGTKAFEYHVDSLPSETRIHLMQKHAAAQAEEVVKKSKPEVSADEKWFEFDNATQKQKNEAQERLKIALLVQGLVDSGTKKNSAIITASKSSRFSEATIRKWFYSQPGLNKIDESDWLAYLLITQGGKQANNKAEFSLNAQTFFKNSYLRPYVTMAEAYRLTVKAALTNGWQVPSEKTVTRWVHQNIPYELCVLMRDGKAAVHQQLVPAQRRTRMGMHALELVSGDGHVARVHCELDNGEIIRPMIWVFQDVFSSAIVGYSIDLSENNEMMAIAIANMADKYGLPGGWTFDRGSAALSDQITGSMVKPNKKGKYKKFDSNELEGLLQMLGYTSSDINWTGIIEDNVGNKGNARSKPVERVFHSRGGIGQFERNPAFAGCYTGKSVVDRPMDYQGGKKGVPFAQFCKVFDSWVTDFNNQLGRRTEMGRGVKSYQQVFDESYAVSQIRKPTPEQLRLCLLRKEAVIVRESGVIELQASKYKEKTDSYYKTNRYHSAMLYDYIGKKIMVRFNPYNMHSEIYAYDHLGRLIGAIPLVEDAGFKSLSAKRMQAVKQKDMKERVDMLAAQANLMDDDEFASMVGSLQNEKSELGSVVPGITEMVPSLPKSLDGFEQKNTALLDNSHDDEDDSEFTENLLNLFGKTG